MKQVDVRVTALLIAVLVSGIGVVYTKHQNRHLFIELQALQKEEDNLAMEWELLQLEESTLATEAVVDEQARTQLDMIGPAPKTVIYVVR
jgi:cell division protein FtsL